MDNNFIIKDDNCVFRIICDDKIDEPTKTIVFGDDESRLEVTTFEGTNQIKSIECIYIDTIENERYYLRDYKEIDNIRKFPDISINYNEEDDNTLILNLFENYLDIILNECLDATHCYIDGRVEYYYDENMSLLYIKVKDLTNEEYQYFQSLQRSAGISK